MNEQKARDEAVRRFGDCDCHECELQRESFIAGVLYATDWFFPQT